MSGYMHVCCCVDTSPQRDLAIAEARRAMAPGSRLTLLHVLDRRPLTGAGAAPLGTSAADQREAAERWLSTIATVIGAETVVLCDDDQALAATAWARDHGVDLLVAAPHHGRLERALRGSFARDLAHGAPCAVLLARAHPSGARRRAETLAVACVERGPAARRVIEEARRLGAARLALLHAHPGDGVGRIAGGWEQVTDPPPRWLTDMAAAAGAHEVVQLRGRTGQAIVAWAEASAAGVLAVAARSRPGPVELLGSVTSHLVAEAPCPVLVACPPAADDDADTDDG